MNLNPISQARVKPCLIAANSAILLEAMPKCREKPANQFPIWFLNMPHVLANPGFPIALPSVLSLIYGAEGIFMIYDAGFFLEPSLQGQLESEIHLPSAQRSE